MSLMEELLSQEFCRKDNKELQMMHSKYQSMENRKKPSQTFTSTTRKVDATMSHGVL